MVSANSLKINIVNNGYISPETVKKHEVASSAISFYINGVGYAFEIPEKDKSAKTYELKNLNYGTYDLLVSITQLDDYDEVLRTGDLREQTKVDLNDTEESIDIIISKNKISVDVVPNHKLRFR